MDEVVRPDLCPERPNYRLFSSGQVIIGTLLGGPVAGCALLAMNANTMKRHRLAVLAAFGGVVYCLGVWVASLKGWLIGIPEAVTYAIFSLIPLFVIPMVFHRIFRADFQAHVDKGGVTGSSTFVVVFSMLTSFLLLGAYFGIYLLAYPRTMQVGNDQKIFYRLGTSADEALRFGKVLQHIGYFSGKGNEAAEIQVQGGTLVIGVFLYDRDLNSDQARTYYKWLRNQIAEEYHQPVRIELMDSHWNVHRTIP